ncbi:YcaO-like family protein [Sphingomicrobium aestuariivivum]|uniref:YcaO-like family protein n=1 Tax=Sphingomicrobium aestuariivivum TaxID=1582356 RepID=UPI001FD6F501|nr:YcaO-like family protein [Sphingomicrobium aestuariivivum]MCJ8189784.1 YcaO-like family protein [Sphingomicrobium aestuariivivum]
MIFPSDRQRAADPGALLSAARRAAAKAGVTRLADVTRLDRIGLPVWQAIRPASRALSVHQGKGASADAARLGALLEAVESDAAERYDGPVEKACWDALPEAGRVRDFADFAADRAAPPPTDREVDWVATERHGGGTLCVPFEAVSLDFTRFHDSPFERASAGLATGHGPEEARHSALHELIERDARWAFEASDFVHKLQLEIRPDTIPYDWFAALRERVHSTGCSLRVFVLPSLTGTPVFGALLRDYGKNATPYGAIVGHAAHPDPEQALFQTVAEAAQGRLTYIAAARDDCYPWQYREGSSFAAFAPPAPTSDLAGLDFAAIPPGPASIDALAERLAANGFDELAFLPIAQVEGFDVVRAFVPGLGTLAKGRRR